MPSRASVYVLRADLVPPRDQQLLRAVARVVILASQGTLAEQVVRHSRSRPGPVPPRLRSPREAKETVPAPDLDLQFFNGIGGFTRDGSEYVTILGKGQWTPAPWINVVANESFGFHVSESGAGYTWSRNSRENKLTPWSNDPVSDTPGEIFYLRDEDSGVIWGPTALPVRQESWPYVIRHGQGYSRFEHESHGIGLDLLQFVPPNDPVKISRLTIVNRSNVTRRLSVTSYVEWVLGVERSSSAPHVVTEVDTKTGAMLARNPWNGEFAEQSCVCRPRRASNRLDCGSPGVFRPKCQHGPPCCTGTWRCSVRKHRRLPRSLRRAPDRDRVGTGRKHRGAFTVG